MLAQGNYSYERIGYLLADLAGREAISVHLPEDRPGSLRALLHVFERHGISLSSIHSSRTPEGDVHFRIGFDADVDAAVLARAAEEIDASGLGRVGMSVAERSRFVVDAVLTGKTVPFTRAGSVSAIAKTPVPGPQRVTRLGIADDEQGDLRVHGGPDKAIHHYPRDHYRAWNADIGLHPLLEQPGAFGENISTTGMLEHTVCLGDRYRMGTALVEVSQSRQPCWKLSDRFAIPDMARRVQDTGRTGWYYRVIEEGYVQQGDTLVLADRPHAAWPLSRLIDLLYQRAIDPGILHDVLELPLVPSWRVLFQRRLERGAVEDWSKRLTGVATDG